ncbi:MAG TPA: MOSC domain-containing protein [Bryobacteraceae bacterium]
MVPNRVVQLSLSAGGIPKRAVAEAIVTPSGIVGDSWARPHIHGGPNQALLLIASEGIDELVAQGFALFYGALGENLTTSGIDRRQMRVGQRYRAGEVFFELTKLRGPCATLNVYPGIQPAIYDPQVKAGDTSSARWGLGGFYARVLRGGTIRQHDIIALVDQVV